MSYRQTKRVVVTGTGVVSANGQDREKFFDNLKKGRVAISDVEGFDTGRLRVKRGGEIKDFDILDHFPSGHELRRLGRAKQMALAAAKQCIEESGFDVSASPFRVGVVIGTTMGESKSLERCTDELCQAASATPAVETLADYLPHTISQAVGRRFGAYGPNAMIPNACAAGNFAIGHALGLIRMGQADAVIAGGSDAFSRYAYAGFARLGAISPDVPRPFSADRQGMIPGEGAAMLFLESLDSALERGAPIYAEVVGYGESCDAYHITQPDDAGIARAIDAALRMAGTAPEAVSYVSVHGTGTPANDTIETRALKKVFGEQIPPVSSVKSMLGHSMGAASAIECVAALMSIREQFITPTMNYRSVDESCALDCVPNEGRRGNVDYVLKTASAFGGNNAAVVFKRFHDAAVQ